MLQHDNLGTPSSVDAKTAEEALALALRLQQERGERVSLEELQKTADEAGIDRVYLEGALRQVAQKAEQKERQAQIAPVESRRFFVMGIAMAVAILIAVIGRTAPAVLDSPAFLAFFLAFFGAAFVTRRAMLGGRVHLRRRFRDR